MKLFKYMALTAFLASYIAILLSKETTCKNIVWFSDRDKIIDSFGKICFDVFEINHYGICLRTMEEGRIPRVSYGVKDADSDNLWFDNLIRIPDYMAGTIASWDIKRNITSRVKHAHILEKVFADNPFCPIIYVNLDRDEFSFYRQDISRTPVQRTD